MTTETSNSPAGKEPVADPAKEPAKEPVADPAKEPAKEPVADPAKEPAKEPVADPAKEPAKEPVAKPNAPEKYAAFVAPEGVNLDAEVTSAFEAVAKELDLPQDKAQTIITKLSPVLKARGEAATAQVRSDMLAALKGDKDIGGEKFQSTVDAAKAAIEVHFTPEFRKFLDDTGLGNHPEMARGLSKIGAKLIADGWVPANKETAKDGDARSFFPNSQMNA